MTDTSTVQSLEEMAAQLAVLNAAVAKLTITVSGVLTEKKFIGPLSIIVEEVAVHTGIRVEHIRGARRKTEYVQARWTAIYIAARLTGYSLTRLAAFFRKDHTSIQHAIRGVEAWKACGDRRYVLVMALMAHLEPQVRAAVGVD